VRPNNAYFGKKDYQQLVIIQNLVKKYSLGVNIIGMPIIREKSGLAMSSRNNYLSDQQKEAALFLSQTLEEISQKVLTSSLEEANLLISKKIEDSRFNYLEIRDPNSFDLAKNNTFPLVILGNLQIGQTRLLDNLEVNK